MTFPRFFSGLLFADPDAAAEPGRFCLVALVGAGPLDAAVGGVQPPDDRVQPEQLRVHDQGQVEVGVGLIPAGGGTKEMLARSVEGLPDPRADLLPRVQRVFETIGFGKVSTSAADGLRIGYLRPVDAMTMNRERVMADAKALARDILNYLHDRT